jgi:DNA invertase Pin-like site-specific DNA recombinase
MTDIAVYLRVSTARQRLDSQRAEITRWLKGQRIDPLDVRWYEDKEGGKTVDRVGFEQLQKAVFAGEVKMLVVWKLDRISRRLKDGINLLSDWIERSIRVIVVTQQIDLSGPVGRMVASVLFGLAEIELEFRRERQSAGIRVAKERGVYRGRTKGSFKAPPGRAIQLRSRGLTMKEIAKALGISERTAFRYVNSLA